MTKMNNTVNGHKKRFIILVFVSAAFMISITLIAMIRNETVSLVTFTVILLGPLGIMFGGYPIFGSALLLACAVMILSYGIKENIWLEPITVLGVVAWYFFGYINVNMLVTRTPL